MNTIEKKVIIEVLTPAPGIEPGFHPCRGRVAVEATKTNSAILSQFLNEQLRMAKKARYPSAEDLI